MTTSAGASGEYDDQTKLRLRTSADKAWRRAGDEIVVLDVAQSTYHATNASATALWEALEAGATPAELAAALQRSYGLDDVTARRDVATFLADLSEAGLLEREAGG
ncbi:MAG TPA: PqqD family protein [Mycobacteriales bacterium]|jgi:hypothetical protein|nr:PqqD family protein [Mycobacteriales bacterium]